MEGKRQKRLGYLGEKGSILSECEWLCCALLCSALLLRLPYVETLRSASVRRGLALGMAQLYIIIIIIIVV